MRGLGDIASAFRAGLQELETTAAEVIAAHDEYVLWRHQIVGDPNPLADNPFGEDPDAFRWRTRDYYVCASVQGEDSRGYKRFYLSDAVPVKGDLLVTLQGPPASQDAARLAAHISYYRVEAVDSRRAPSGELVYALVSAKMDYSGKYGPTT